MTAREELINRIEKLNPIRQKVAITLFRFIVWSQDHNIEITDEAREKIASIGKDCSEKNDYTEFYAYITQLKEALA